MSHKKEENSQNPLFLQGLKALVTGGTRGLGLATATKLAHLGANVWISGRSKEMPAGLSFSYLQVDFADRAKTASLAKEVGTLKFDILVNNAGVNKIGPFQEITSEDFDRIQDVNVRAPFMLCQSVLPHMESQGWGRIVNITSIFGVVTKEYRASYSTSKHGLAGLTSAIAVENAPKGILVNCVAPGFCETDLTRNILTPDAKAEIVKQIPVGRFGKPEEIAELVAWLSSRQNTYVTGQSFVIDGGFTSV